MEKGYPLILVFYLNREMMRNRDVIAPFAESVNAVIAQREANAMAFFLPTDGEERIECINPLTATEDQMERVNTMIEELQKNFDVGQGADESLDETVEGEDV
jgi:hypothetical protein